MAKKDKSKSGSEKKPKSSEVDLDKTVLDVDLNKLNLEEEEGEPPESPTLDETVMIRVPPPEEDSDLHDLGELAGEEDTGSHAMEEGAEAPVPEEPVAPSQAKEPPAKEKATPAPPPQAAAPRKDSPSRPLTHPETGKAAFSLGHILLALVFWVALLAGLLEALRSGGLPRVPAILAASFTGLVFLGALLRRWESAQAFHWVAAGWFAYVTYVVFYLPTSSTPYFLNFSVGAVYGPFATIIALVVALSVIRSKGVLFFAKVFAALGLFLWLLAEGLSLMQGQVLEGSLWGPEWLAFLPLFLRPSILAMSWGFPLLGLGVLLGFFGWRKGGQGLFKSPVVPLLLICLTGTLASAKLLARQGWTVPIVNQLAGESYLGTTLTDVSASAVRVILADDEPQMGRDDLFRLTLASSSPQTKKTGKLSRLLVRNPEGRSFVNLDLKNHLYLVRGAKPVKGGKLSLDPSRLGQPRHLGVVVDLPSLVKTEVRQSLFSALWQLGGLLGSGDQIYLATTGGTQGLKFNNTKEWNKLIRPLLSPEGIPPTEGVTQVFKTMAPQKGLKQILYVTEVGKLPPANSRQDWIAQAAKGKVQISFVVLGQGQEEGPNLYEVLNPASLGFQMLSAASESLGDYQLQIPGLPPLPKIKLTRDPQGQVQISDGKISFQIEAPNPGELIGLQFKWDNNPPVDLDPKQLSQEIDLAAKKVKPGQHQFTLSLSTEAGDLVSESFEARFEPKKPLQFVKPLEQDSVSGTINVLFSPAKRSGLQTTALELFVDGIPSGRATTEPYLISLDTTALNPGEHTLQGVQYYSDGTSEAVEVKVQVAPTVPMVKIIRPSNGEFLANVAEIEAQVGGGLLEQIDKVDYYVNGQWIGESNQAPHRYLWANHNFPAGKYFIQARAQLASGPITTDAVQVQLSQAELKVQADPSQSPTGNLFPENVEVLIDASVSMQEALGPLFKFDLAKTALNEVMESLPQNVRLLTRVYGVDPESGQKDCEATRLLKTPREELPALQAGGASNLAYALESMAKDLKKAQGSRMGLIITDGWDRCGGDPIAVAESLSKGKNKTRLHVIYFDTVNPTEQSLLKRLAEITGGRSYVVRRPEDLLLAIRDAAQVNFTLYDFKNAPVVNQPLSDQPFLVRTGDYRLEVDTIPPIGMENLSVSSGGTRVFMVEAEGEGYRIREAEASNSE